MRKVVCSAAVCGAVLDRGTGGRARKCCESLPNSCHLELPVTVCAMRTVVKCRDFVDFI